MRWQKLILGLLIVCLIGGESLNAQRVKWKKRVHKPPLDVQLFHSTIVANLPTTETLRQGNFEFIVSHRFIPALSSGFDNLWGVDGPAYNRLSLAYAITNRLMVELGRSNRLRNMDFTLKTKVLQKDHPVVPLVVGLRLGAAVSPLNPEIYGRNRWHPRNFQYFGQLMVNTLISKKVGLGIVPAWVYNSDLFSTDVQQTLALGSYVQVYVSPSWNLWAEAAPVISGFQDGDFPLTVGIEFETGGHFFKIFLTNSTRLNSVQFLAGSGAQGSGMDQWHLGFTITRLLSLGAKW
ncbi:MAG: hypothetical protein GXO78_13940 [Calditrichaeota bacterium]|nr:hypothetical protein [Calditrichota bacterium]